MNYYIVVYKPFFLHARQLPSDSLSTVTSPDPLAKGINDGNPREEKDTQEFPSLEFLKEEDNTVPVLENSAVCRRTPGTGWSSRVC